MQDDTTTTAAWGAALRRREDDEAKLRAELKKGEQSLLPHIVNLAPSAQRYRAGALGASAQLAPIARIPQELFDGGCALVPECIFAAGGPWLRLADDAAGLALYAYVTLSRTETEAAFVATRASPQRTRGRRPKFDWETALRGVHADLYANGLPEHGDGRQAAMERQVSEHFGTDGPAESVTRQRVASAISEARKALAGEAGNS